MRHAQASFGAARYDMLSGNGVIQSEALAADLARRGQRIDHVVSGSLARQRDTAAPVAAAARVPARIDPRWDEYDADDILARHSTGGVRLEHRSEGEGADMSAREFQDVLERALSAWIAADSDGPTAEPWPVFASRVWAAFADLQAGLSHGERAMVCTSGGVLAAICVALLGVPATAFLAFNRVVVNTGVTRIASGRAGLTLVSFNEHAHLELPGRSLVTYR